MISWRCHSNSVDTVSSLPNISGVLPRKIRNVIGIDMIRNYRIASGVFHKKYTIIDISYHILTIVALCEEKASTYLIEMYPKSLHTDIYYQATSIETIILSLILIWRVILMSSWQIINILSLICFTWNGFVITSHIKGDRLRYDVALTNPFLQSKLKLYISIEYNKLLFILYFFIRQVEWVHDATRIILFDIIILFIERCSDKLSRNQPSSVYTEEIWCVYCRWGFSSFTSGMFRTVVLCW